MKLRHDITSITFIFENKAKSNKTNYIILLVILILLIMLYFLFQYNLDKFIINNNINKNVNIPVVIENLNYNHGYKYFKNKLNIFALFLHDAPSLKETYNIQYNIFEISNKPKVENVYNVYNTKSFYSNYINLLDMCLRYINEYNNLASHISSRSSSFRTFSNTIIEDLQNIKQQLNEIDNCSVFSDTIINNSELEESNTIKYPLKELVDSDTNVDSLFNEDYLYESKTRNGISYR
jgi:hypothetical protein